MSSRPSIADVHGSEYRGRFIVFAKLDMKTASAQESNGLAVRFQGEWKSLGFAIGLVTTCYYMYVATFGTFSPALDRSLFIYVGVALAVCIFPLGESIYARMLDVVFLAAVSVATFRFNEHYLIFAENEGYDIGDFDMVMGWIMILGVIEASRRSLGIAMAVISVAFLTFLYFGAYVPWPFVHSGFNLRQIATSLYAQTDGLYGSITYVLSSNLFLFLVFGVFLIRSGASDFFTNICLSFLGTRPGGGAKAAVGASFITASISGSASANVAITGNITIPMMIRTGYRPAVAGGIEAAASTGGTVMPPVMGASAFIMVALTGYSYGQIVLYATIPALLYFLNVYLQVHFYAMRNDLKGLPAEECPPFRATLKKGWVYLTPIAIVIVLVYLDYSLRRVGLLAIVSVIAASWFTDRRMGPREIVMALADGAKSTLPIIAIAGPVSIIAGAMLLPGTGIRVTGLIIDLGQSNLAFTVMFIFIIAYILGMGLSVIPAYVILATSGRAGTDSTRNPGDGGASSGALVGPGIERYAAGCVGCLYGGGNFQGTIMAGVQCRHDQGDGDILPAGAVRLSAGTAAQGKRYGNHSDGGNAGARRTYHFRRYRRIFLCPHGCYDAAGRDCDRDRPGSG